MAKPKTVRRTLFSVIETTCGDERPTFEVDWHRDMYPILDDVSPNGEVTDRIVDIAEELTQPDDEENESASAP